MAIYNTSGQRVIQNSNLIDKDLALYHQTRHLDSGLDDLNNITMANPYAFRQVSYPTDITTNPERGHYMLFYVNVQDKTKYKHTNPKTYAEVGNRVITRVHGLDPSSSDYATDYISWAGGEGMDIEDFAGEDRYTNRQGTGSHKYKSVAAGGIGNIDRSDVHYLAKGRPEGHGPTSGMEAWKPTTTRITDSIALYLPANITSDLTAKYDDATMGMIGMAMASGFDFKQNWDEDDFEGAANALKGFVKGMGYDTAIRGAAGLVDFLQEGANTYGSINKALQQASNPYLEVIFENIEQRSFTYKFNFQPKDEKERDDVQEIIKLFRFHMAPELQPGNMRFLGIPATFDIHYMYQTSDYGESGSMDWRNARENDFYNKIATCVLTNVSVDYTPDGVRSFRDGSPTAITMSLSFKETELLTKDKINKGY